MKKTYLILFAGLIVAGCNLNKEPLALQLESGKIYKHKTVSNIEMEQTIQDQVIEMDIQMKGDMIFGVEGFENDRYLMRTRFTRLGLKVESPFGMMEFDSDNEEQSEVAGMIFSRLTMNSFNVSMSPTGKVTEVTGVESLFENAFDVVPDLSGQQIMQLQEQLRQTYGAEPMQGSIEMVTAIFPDKPVAVGNSWKINTQLKSGVQGVVKTKFTYEEDNENYRLIRGVSEIQPLEDTSYKNLNGMPARHDMRGSMTSMYKIDKITGWVIEATIEQELEGDVYIIPNEETGEEIKVPMRMKTNTVIGGA